MKITAHFTTQLKASLGIAEETLEIGEPPVLSNLFAILTQKHGDAFSQFALGADGSLLPSLIICIDDQQVRVADDPKLEAHSHVTFLSAISGG